MGSSSPAPYVPPAQPDPAAVAAAQQAAALQQQTAQVDLAGQDNLLQRTYGAAASGSLNGLSSAALTPLGSVAGMR